MNQSYRFVFGMFVFVIAHNKTQTADFDIHSWNLGYNTYDRYLFYDWTKLRVFREHEEQKAVVLDKIVFSCDTNQHSALDVTK